MERPRKIWLGLCGSHRLRVGADTEDLLEKPYLMKRHIDDLGKVIPEPQCPQRTRWFGDKHSGLDSMK